MRLPFPERLPLTFVIFFAIVLAGVQLLQGTNPRFTIYCFLFIILVSMAFNLVGGFTRPSGGYIFFYSFGVVVGVVGKAILGERADSNLQVPNLTMLVFLGGAVSLLISAFLCRRFRRNHALLQDVVKQKDMRNGVYGCMITGIVLAGILYLPANSGSILSALAQINQFMPMAIIFGVIYQMRKTGGLSAMNLTIALSIAFVMFNYGIIHFSKQGLFLPIACWVFTAAAMRYRMSWPQVIGASAFIFILVYYFVPYSQIGRHAEGVGESPTGDWVIAASMLKELPLLREQYVAEEAEAYQDNSIGYYNGSEGFLDRLQIFRPDDDLINETEERGTVGLGSLRLYFLNLIPHVFYPNKPDLLEGNTYAHQIGGILADEDETTGISFSPTGEAYHMDKWVGVLLVTPVLWTILFIHFDSLCGDVRRSPWGLLTLAVFSHAAPEGMLGAIPYLLGYTTFTLVFAAIAVAYIMPILGTLFAGPDKTRFAQRLTR